MRDDPIIDRSPNQKRMRVDKMREELLHLGYSVVTTAWLHSVLSKLTMKGERPELMEAAE